MNDRFDLRDALRALRRQPAFTVAAIVTFALALGTPTAIFAALHAVILTPLPFAEPSRLIIAWRQNPASAQPVVEVSHHQFREWQARTRSFARLAAMWSVTSRPTWTLSSGERRKVASAPVSHEFFSVLGVARSSAAAFSRRRIASTPPARSCSARPSGGASSPATPRSSDARSPWTIVPTPSSG